MRSSRRQFLSLTAGVTIAGALPPAAPRAQEKAGTRLILLGTHGGPRVGGRRNNPSTLILVNGVPYVIDCGAGVSRQLVAAGVPLPRLRYLFLTHLHSDHMIEYGPLFYNAWVTGGGTVDGYGPPPLRDTTRAFWDYMKFDVETRMADEGRPDPRPMLVAHEIAPGLVMQNADVKVTCTTVAHPPVKQAYAFRFDARDRSIVISGDTNYSTNLIALAKGADVLVHEVLHPPAVDKIVARIPNAATLRKHIIDSHTTPEDAGRVAAAAGVKTLVLSHFVPGDDFGIPDETWTAGVRKHFSGRIVLGRDLMEI